MATTLVRRGKLLRPRPAPDHIARPRLIDRLTAGLDRPLTLVSTPAGYGKTTLLGQWLDAAPQPAAWLALDAHDNALPSFVAAVIGALSTLWPEAGRETLGLLQLPTTPPPDYLGATLADELLDLPGPALLVLDDYHTVDDPAVHAFVAGLLEYPPPSLRLALASRVEPPLPLPRLRARDRVTELRGHDLAFTPAEALAFLERAGGAPVDAVAAELLERRTEGWAVGLRLAALALRAEGDAGRVARAFAGRRQRHALDFLLDEVLARQPGEVQAFLLRTAVVERVCGPLAEALLDPTPAPGAGELMLRRLVDANLFVVELEAGDDGLAWARYHQLFRELLRERLLPREGPAAAADLHRRAANWLVAHELIDEAIAALLAGDEPDGAARLVEARVAAALDREDWVTLWRWLGRLPEEVTRRRPGLLLAHAFVDQFRGWRRAMATRLEAATALLDADDPPLPPAEAARLRAQVDVIASFICAIRGDGDGAIEAARRALPQLPDPASYLGGAARYLTGVGLHLAGQTAEALRGLGDSADGAAANARAPREMYALATIHLQAGTLGAARRWAALLLEVSTRRDLSLMSGWARYLLGRVAYELDEVEEAQAHFAAVAAERYRRHGVTVAEALLGLALTEQAAGRPGGAARLLDELDETLTETGNDEARPLVLACQAELALQRGDHGEAIRWLESGLPYSVEILTLMEYPSLTRARALLARGAPGDAAAAAAFAVALGGRAEREHATGCLIRALAVEALAHHARGDGTSALACLARAVTLAEPGGFVRAFLDLGAPMIALLRELAGRRPPSAHLARLLAAADAPGRPPAPEETFERVPTGIAAPPAAGQPTRIPPATRDATLALALVETLTEREIQVLGRLGHHLSNKEIAAELHISPMTVKRHVSNLCGKLGAGTRRQAVAIAAALGFIPPPSPW